MKAKERHNRIPEMIVRCEEWLQSDTHFSQTYVAVDKMAYLHLLVIWFL